MIELIHGLYVDADDRNIVLGQKRTREKGNNVGEEYTINIGYYNNLTNALIGAHRYLMREKIKESELVTLQRAIKESDAIYIKLENLVNPRGEVTK